LNARGQRLAARPQLWKHTRDGDVVTDARIAQMRLAGKTDPLDLFCPALNQEPSQKYDNAWSASPAALSRNVGVSPY